MPLGLQGTYSVLPVGSLDNPRVRVLRLKGLLVTGSPEGKRVAKQRRECAHAGQQNFALEMAEGASSEI